MNRRKNTLTRGALLPLVAALGSLGLLPGLALAVDPSQWKCETCPFEKAGTSGSVDVGLTNVNEAAPLFGDFSGLKRKGGTLALGGELQVRGANGYYADLVASDLGLDVRSLQARSGREGQYALRLGWSEIDHRPVQGASTPFLGIGSGTLTLPGGYPRADTGAMPLSTTLAPLDVGFTRSRLDLGATLPFEGGWSTRVDVRHDSRDGVQRLAGSFFSTAAQLAAPVNDSTDQIEAALAYTSKRLQASLSYRGSLYRNQDASLTWSNPFIALVNGAEKGQVARAPNNQFHQLAFSGGFDVTSAIRASADLAWGRGTQDAGFLPITTNPNLATGALAAGSLNGKVDTFDAAVRLTAQLSDQLRVNASYARNVRDNRTGHFSLPAVDTDVFLGTTARVSQPYSFTQDRGKLWADYRFAGVPGQWKLSGGVDENDMDRTLQEVVTTRESTLWGRLSARPVDALSLSLKLAHADRHHTAYGVAPWIVPAENPLLKKFYLARRQRDTLSLRADLSVGEAVALGFTVDGWQDDYSPSQLGLLRNRSGSVGLDLAASLGEKTQLRAFVQAERGRSRQAGSQAYAQADWWARSSDLTDVWGVGLTHQALGGKLELAADALSMRSHGDIAIDTSLSSAFPTVATQRDALRVQASYQLEKSWSLLGTYWYERLVSSDWHWDGVGPATVSNLLAFGEQAPHHRVHALRLALRYRF